MTLSNEILYVSLESLEGTVSKFRVTQVGTHVKVHHPPHDYYDYFSACAEAVKQAETFNVPIKINCTIYRR